MKIFDRLQRTCQRGVFNPFMSSRLFHLSSLDESISNYKGCLVSFLSQCFIYIPVLNANSVDPDQTPHSVASDLGLQCMPMSHLPSSP